MRKKRILIASLLISILLPSASANAETTRLRTARTVTVTIDQKTITLVPPISNSPGKISLQIENPLIAKVDGLVVTLLATGITQYTFTQAASGAFGAATRSANLYVLPGVPVVNPWANQSVPLTAGQYVLVAPTSTSPGSWSYTSSNSAVATVIGNTLTLLDGGEVTVTATQAPTSTWKTATASAVITVTALTPTVSTIPDISLSINSVSTLEIKDPVSNSTGTWSYSSSNSAIASIIGRRITALTPGSVVITAKQARSGAYRSYTTTFKVNIDAIEPSLSSGGFVDTTINLSTVSKAFSLFTPLSNSPGRWEVRSSDESIVGVGAISLTNEISLIAYKPGTVKLTATQGTSGTFGSVTPNPITITVKGIPVISKLTDLERVSGDPDFAITFPVSSSPGAWTITSSAPNVSTVKLNSITFTDAGTSTITLSQAASENWLAANTTFLVRVNGLTPTLGAFNQVSVGVNEKLPVSAFPMSNSKGAWIATSDNLAIATFINGSIVGVAPGTTKISAYQEAAGKYGRSNILSTTITVKPNPIVEKLANITTTLGSAPITVSYPKSNSNGGWVLDAVNKSVVSISGNRLTFVGLGETEITARQLPTAQYGGAEQKFTVNVVAPPAPKAIASVSGRKIKVLVQNATPSSISITINGKIVRPGTTSVGPGKRKVEVKVAGELILSKTFTIK